MTFTWSHKVWLYAGLGALSGLLLGGPLGAAMGATLGAGAAGVAFPKPLQPIHPAPTTNSITPWNGMSGVTSLQIGGVLTIFSPIQEDGTWQYQWGAVDSSDHLILTPPPIKPSPDQAKLGMAYQFVGALPGLTTVQLSWYDRKLGAQCRGAFSVNVER